MKMIQLTYPERVHERIGSLYDMAGEPDIWTLTIDLEGEKIFKTKLELKGMDIFLHRIFEKHTK
ncbi:MAG: hypothetical protein JRI34_05175 [Deltaproteobacteria bacterium]|nr:hypothetical protein [Deltaproteobacteria bacterium]